MANNFSNGDNIFEDVLNPEELDAIDVVNIDVDSIEKESEEDAKSVIENITKLCSDEEFMKNNPNFKKRVDTEMESLRILIKMRKSDEVIQDILIKAIGGNSGNASLYRSLSEMQKTILAVTAKISESINELNKLFKNYQLELNFVEQENEPKPEDNTVNISTGTCRGSKEFIKQMIDKSNQSQLIFEDDNKKEEAF